MQSSNGWKASADQADIAIAMFTIVGGAKPVRLRCAKAAAPLLVAACKEWHAKVEPLEPGQVQGYAFRQVRGGADGTLSNHASGSAVDIWPARHPQGDSDGNFTKEQQATVLEICKKYGLRSGGTYKTAKPDWMHIEINLDTTQTKLLIERLKLK